MTRRITGRPFNLSRKHRVMPSAEHRQCQWCSSRNAYVRGDAHHPEAPPTCHPTCAKVREFLGTLVDLRKEGMP